MTAELKALQKSAIIAYLAKDGPLSFDVLCNYFAEENGTGQSALRKLLTRMIEAGELVKTQRSKRHLYDVPRNPKTDEALPPVQQVVPPRQYDVMNGPVYTPAQTPPMRLGAMDFKQLPSLTPLQRSA